MPQLQTRLLSKLGCHMVQIKQVRFASIGLVLGLSLTASVARAQEDKKKPERAADEVEALIDQLKDLDQQDTGYSGSVSGSAFLPLGQRETHTILFGQKPHGSSDALKSLVKLGTK